MIGAVLGFLKPVFGIIDKAVKDKDLAMKIKAEIELDLLKSWDEFVKASRDVIVAEIKGESAAQRNWRPHLMYLIMALLVWNGVAVPLITAFTGAQIPVLQAWEAIPAQMWTLLTTGLGGYIVGRSVEKSVKTWKG